MNALTRLVIFCLDTQRYALALDAVECIVRAVEVTPLPKAPLIVLGVIDVAGRVIPALNIRRRFRLPERKISPVDQFLLAHTTRRTVALLVDETQGVIEHPTSEVIGAAQIVPGLDQTQGIVRLDDGLVLIHDLEKFLSLDEAHALDEAMNHKTAHGT